MIKVLLINYLVNQLGGLLIFPVKDVLNETLRHKNRTHAFLCLATETPWRTRCFLHFFSNNLLHNFAI